MVIHIILRHLNYLGRLKGGHILFIEAVLCQYTCKISTEHLKYKRNCKSTKQRILEKVMGQGKEIKQNWTGWKNFEVYFCIIFACYDQIFISERETWHQALSSLRYSQCFPLSYEISLTLFGNFVTLDIMPHFTCGESDLYQNGALSENFYFCSFVLYIYYNDSSFLKSDSHPPKKLFYLLQ